MAATNCLDPVAGAPQLGDFQFEGVFGVDSATDVNILSGNDLNLTSTFDMLFTSTNNNITFSTPGDSFEVNASQDVRINSGAELRLNCPFLTAPAMPTATTASVVYIHPTSHALSRGAPPAFDTAANYTTTGIWNNSNTWNFTGDFDVNSPAQSIRIRAGSIDIEHIGGAPGDDLKLTSVNRNVDITAQFGGIVGVSDYATFTPTGFGGVTLNPTTGPVNISSAFQSTIQSTDTQTIKTTGVSKHLNLQTTGATSNIVATATGELSLAGTTLFSISDSTGGISTDSGEMLITLAAGGAITLNDDSLSFYLPNNVSQFVFGGNDVDMNITLNKVAGGGNFNMTAFGSSSLTSTENNSFSSDATVFISGGTGINLDAPTGSVSLTAPGGSFTCLVQASVDITSTGNGGFQVDGGDTLVYNSGAGGQYFGLYASGVLTYTGPGNVSFTTSGGNINLTSTVGTVNIIGDTALILNSSGLQFANISEFAHTHMIYYNPVNDEVTYALPPSPVLPFVSVAGTSQALVVNTSYVAKNVALTTFTLPATAAEGSVIQISGATAGLFDIAQNAGQSVRLGSTITTVGVTGSTTSTAVGNAIYLQCITADTEFIVLNSVGTFNLV